MDKVQASGACDTGSIPVGGIGDGPTQVGLRRVVGAGLPVGGTTWQSGLYLQH